MEFLVHRTTNKEVFDKYNKDKKFEILYNSQLKSIRNFYDKYYMEQVIIPLVINYYNPITNENIYTVGKVSKSNESYYFEKNNFEVSEDFKVFISIVEKDEYDGIYFKEFSVDSDMNIKVKVISDYNNKLRIKFLTWSDLHEDISILHEELINYIFNENNVFDLATTYIPKELKLISKEKIYHKTLKKIGFISETPLNPDSTILDGDIGEFLMSYLISNLIVKDKSKTYVYPKLVLKTPGSSPGGHDGSIYIIEDNLIYYMESKFYTELKLGLHQAIESLKKHQVDALEPSVELDFKMFRNISSREVGEILELDDQVKEEAIIFVMCGDVFSENDVKDILVTSQKLKDLRSEIKVTVYILPILDKKKFKELFIDKSVKLMEEINGND